MGNTPSSPVHVSVKVPSRDNKILKCKFVRDSPPDGQTVKDYFTTAFEPFLDPQYHGLLYKVTVVIRGTDLMEVEVDKLNDEISVYLQMGLSRVTFYLSAPEIQWGAPPLANIQDVLVREKESFLPVWSHAGRPALTELHRSVREMLTKDHLGFRGSHDKKMGAEWMLALVEVLYKLSPFHGRLKARGYPVPNRFAFSEGSNDFKKKGKSCPNLTQALIEEVCRVSCTVVGGVHGWESGGTLHGVVRFRDAQHAVRHDCTRDARRETRALVMDSCLASFLLIGNDQSPTARPLPSHGH